MTLMMKRRRRSKSGRTQLMEEWSFTRKKTKAMVHDDVGQDSIYASPAGELRRQRSQWRG